MLLLLALDDLPPFVVVSRVDTLAVATAGIERAMRRSQVSTHPTPAGGTVLVSWRAVGVATVTPAPG